MNISLTLDVIETILKNNHIFNNILITSWPRVIEISSKHLEQISWNF